jgi:hypothetical protein
MVGRSSGVLPLALLLLSAAAGLEVELKPNEERCVQDVVAKGANVRARFKVLSKGVIDVKLTDSSPTGKTLARRGAREGDLKFAAATSDGDSLVSLCFVNSGEAEEERVWFTFANGVEATDYAEVAAKDHLKPLHLELRKMEDALSTVHAELLDQRERAKGVRDANNAISATQERFSVFTMAVLLAFGIWQVATFRSFLHKKKYI